MLHHQVVEPVLRLQQARACFGKPHFLCRIDFDALDRQFFQLGLRRIDVAFGGHRLLPRLLVALPRDQAVAQQFLLALQHQVQRAQLVAAEGDRAPQRRLLQLRRFLAHRLQHPGAVAGARFLGPQLAHYRALRIDLLFQLGLRDAAEHLALAHRVADAQVRHLGHHAVAEGDDVEGAAFAHDDALPVDIGRQRAEDAPGQHRAQHQRDGQQRDPGARPGHLQRRVELLGRGQVVQRGLAEQFALHCASGTVVSASTSRRCRSPSAAISVPVSKR